MTAECTAAPVADAIQRVEAGIPRFRLRGTGGIRLLGPATSVGVAERVRTQRADEIAEAQFGRALAVRRSALIIPRSLRRCWEPI